MGTPCEWQSPGLAPGPCGPLTMRKPPDRLPPRRRSLPKATGLYKRGNNPQAFSPWVGFARLTVRPARRRLGRSLAAPARSAASSASSAGNLGLQLLLPRPGIGRHGAHRVELLAGDQIQFGGHALDALAHAGLDLLPQPAQGVEGPARHSGQIVEQAVAGLHGILLASGADGEAGDMGRCRNACNPGRRCCPGAAPCL